MWTRRCSTTCRSRLLGGDVARAPSRAVGRRRLADGGVSDRERDLILALAASRGIEPDTPAHKQLTRVLQTRPPRRLLDAAYRVITATFAVQPPDTRENGRRELTAWATKVAEATGGILGMMPVSREERDCLRLIAERVKT